VEVLNNSDATSLLAIQGPQSRVTLQKLTNADLSVIPYYAFVQTKVAGIDMLVSRTGYTGELGYEIYFDAAQATGEKIWNAVMDAGKEFGIQPIGLGARDTLRLEMGMCLYGNDIDQTTNPLEAGLGWITKLDKGPFIGSDVIQKVKAEGVTRKLVGFAIDEDKAFPRHGYEIQWNGSKLGQVTSGTVSPILEKGIGMGYVAVKSADPGNPISIIIRNKEVKAQIVKPPFIQK
jgi:aminomethyltransferase